MTIEIPNVNTFACPTGACVLTYISPTITHSSTIIITIFDTPRREHQQAFSTAETSTTKALRPPAKSNLKLYV